MVDTVDQLFQEAKQKVAYEMHNATNGKKTKARKFMDNFYPHDPNNFCWLIFLPVRSIMAINPKWFFSLVNWNGSA